MREVTASHVGTGLWTAQVTTRGTAQTVCLVLTFTGSPTGSVMGELWHNGQLAATPATCATRGSGSAPSTSLTTGAANSSVPGGSGDRPAISPNGPTYKPTLATPPASAPCDR